MVINKSIFFSLEISRFIERFVLGIRMSGLFERGELEEGFFLVNVLLWF